MKPFAELLDAYAAAVTAKARWTPDPNAPPGANCYDAVVYTRLELNARRALEAAFADRVHLQRIDVPDWSRMRVIATPLEVPERIAG